MRRSVALGLLLASGFAGLGYQVVWLQQCALWLGHEAAAVLAVVAAFFGGLATGAFAFAPRIERSARPLRWYAACEFALALWCLVLAFGLRPVADAMLAVVGPQPAAVWQWSVAFGGTYLLLLPATAAMGATLPAMERALRGRAWPAATVGRLYAANTFGAVLGVLATTFVLVPAIGLLRTALTCATLNAACAIVAWRAARATGAATTAPTSAGAAPDARGSRSVATAADPAARSGSAGTRPSASALAPAGERTVLALLAATGLLGIAYEVLVIRVLSQVAENTVYTYALLLAVYLVGTAGGAALYARAVARGSRSGAPAADPAARFASTGARLLAMQAAACLAGLAALWVAERVRDAVLDVAGAGFATALAAETSLAVAAFLLPTFVMGALFSHLSGAAIAAGAGLGRALGWNTLGACAAPALAGVLLVPAFGPKAALLAVVAGYLALAAALGARAPSRDRAATIVGAASAAAVFALALLAPPLAFVSVPAGGRLVEYREGALGAVSVVADADGVERLHIDNRQQEGSSATHLADGRQALLPLLLHPAPRHALFLGLGTGVTASTAATERALQVEAVELLPEVVAASARFRATFDGGAPPLTLRVADARRFVRTSPVRYDVVVADNFHPARSGSGALYTVEHFRAVHERLAPGGLFCQWLPLHQLDLRTLRSIVRSFLAAYPAGAAVLATHSLDTPVVGLVARADGGRFDPAAVRARLARFDAPRGAAEYGFENELAVLGAFVAGPESLARFAADAPLNTDDRPVVAHLAPRITYAPDSLPRDRLGALLAAVDVDASGVLVDPLDPMFASRLAAYWTARDRFIDAGRDVRPSRDPERMLAQVQAPLLDVLRTSPDFRPAYDPLLRLAGALGDTNAARALLAELHRLQPERGEAHAALDALDAADAVDAADAQHAQHAQDAGDAAPRSARAVIER